MLIWPRMKQVWKLGAIVALAVAVWLSLLLHSSDLPKQFASVLPYLPVYGAVALGCYGLGMVGYGLMVFPLCPKEAVLLQQDILEAKEYLSRSGFSQVKL